MPFNNTITRAPTPEEIKREEKKHKPCDVDLELMLADLLDLTDDIYVGLLKTIEKPNNISSRRFKTILQIKATIFNLFVSGKLIIDKILDDLEKDCALNMASISTLRELDKNNLHPKKYKNVVNVHRVDAEDEIEEYCYSPIISKEILQIKYPESILEEALKKQLQKHGVNVASSKNLAKFLKSDGWMSFFGVVPLYTAVDVLKEGTIFIDPPDYPDTDSRIHSPYAHAIQEYLISKLMEGGYLGDFSVEGEADITERELVQADAWPIKKDGVPGVSCLFDIMRERRPKKLQLLDVYPDAVYGFTSPDFVNQYLMLSSYRFPSLSTFLYNQFAHATLNYFKLMQGFANLSQEEQLQVMNIHDRHNTMAGNLDDFMTQHPNAYLKGHKLGNSGVMLKCQSKPLFKFTYTQDDSESYVKARKKIEAQVVDIEEKSESSDLFSTVDLALSNGMTK